MGGLNDWIAKFSAAGAAPAPQEDGARAAQAGLSSPTFDGSSTSTATTYTTTTTTTTTTSTTTTGGHFIDLDSNASSPFSNNQPPTPNNDNFESDAFTMQMTSPIDIATPTRNASSSPSSQGVGVKPTTNFLDPDSRTSAMMSSNNFENGMGRGRQDSFAGAKPISMNNPNRNADGRPRRESLAGSLVQGMSWGGVSVGSWIRDE